MKKGGCQEKDSLFFLIISDVFPVINGFPYILYYGRSQQLLVLEVIFH